MDAFPKIVDDVVPPMVSGEPSVATVPVVIPPPPEMPNEEVVTHVEVAPLVWR